MAQRVMTIHIDDLDGESEADETLVFGLDGQSYEMELTSANAAALREAIAPYVEAARRSGETKRTRSSRTARATGAIAPSAEDIRAWARQNKLKVSERGRISATVREAYEAAHT